ncbi:alpha-L-rhamnosidase C-terminal domain-containing protein [Nonomuraea bangladeshensis]|uniref:alpha-L-rhamnosidase C-terminal domain-containing protein n=1 Tax=Nonomuraea bangladeshensis TaxID=404385 RepID=UPI003C2FD273
MNQRHERATADWIHRTVVGLAPAAPGYRRLLVRPRPGGGLTRARATHHTPYGMAEVSWKRDGARLTLRVVVPANTTAVVYLPGEPGAPIQTGSGTHVFHCTLRSADRGGDSEHADAQ